MKALLLLSFLFVLTITAKSFAAPEEASKALPRPILEMQETMAVQGTCEKRWPELVQEMGMIKEELETGMTIYIVPCAYWAHNVGYAVYVTIKESSHPDGFITKAMRFVNYSPYEGVVARDLIHNIKWDSATKTLKAQYFINGSEMCGSKSEYKWHGGYQTLLTRTLLKQDDCKNAQAPWVPVFN